MRNNRNLLGLAIIVISTNPLSFLPMASANSSIESLESPQGAKRQSIIKDADQTQGVKDFNQGLSYGRHEEYEQAVNAFNKAEAEGFKAFELFLFRGQAYHEIKRYVEAEADASRAVALQPMNGYAYQLRAAIYQSTERWEDAIKDLSTGVTIASKELAAKLYQARGIINLRLARRKEALDDLSQALSLGNATPVVYYKRGRTYTELSRYSEAIQDFSEALKRQQNHYKSRLNRGWVNGCIGEFDKSIHDFDHLLSNTPEDVLVHGLRGWARLESNDVEGGLSDLLYAMEHGDKDPWTYLNIASAYYIKGMMNKAIDANAQGLALNDPSSQAVLHFQKGLLLLVAGRSKEARASYDRARKLAVKNSERLQLQEATADLREAVKFHEEIKGQAKQILKELEKTLSITKVSKGLIPKQCQQLRNRQEYFREG